MQTSKIYILIKNKIPVGHACNCAAHASLALYLEHPNRVYVDQWANESFRKVSCKVDEETFYKAKDFIGKIPHTLITESVLGGAECAIAFGPLPHNEWPDFFKTLSLYR